MENKEKIIEALKKSETSLKSGEISEITGIDKKEVDKILKKLKDEEIIISPKRCFYDLKKR